MARFVIIVPLMIFMIKVLPYLVQFEDKTVLIHFAQLWRDLLGFIRFDYLECSRGTLLKGLNASEE